MTGRRSIAVLAWASFLSLAACTAAAPATGVPPSAVAMPMAEATPAPIARTEPLHVVISSIAFPTFRCRQAGQDPCRAVADSTSTADASSNLAGTGSMSTSLAVDFTDPGPKGDCNTVDETGTFTFPTGTISFRSWHRDCNFDGPRIQTVFAITGGTGAFAGAVGYGTERDDAPDGFVYDGSITYVATTSTPSPS